MLYYDKMTVLELEQERERLEDELTHHNDMEVKDMISEEIDFIDNIIAGRGLSVDDK